MTRKEALECARRKVCETGEQSHGSAENSFNDIANLWTAYKGIDFSSSDVAIMMALLKIARIKNDKDKEDSFVDLIGYAACATELECNCKENIKDEKWNGIE